MGSQSDKGKEYEVGGKRITTILIKVCEIEANLVERHPHYYSFGFHLGYIDELLEGLVRLGQDDPRVLAHLKKYRDGVLAESPRTEKLRVKYDTLIRELQQK